MRDDVESVVRKIVERAIEEKVPVSRAVRKKDVEAVNGSVRNELVRQGIIYVGNNLLHKQNGSGWVAEKKSESECGNGKSSVSQTGHPHPRDEADVLKRIMVAVGGKMLPVIDASVPHLRAAGHEARGKAYGFYKRAAALEFAADACEEYEAETPADLPEKVRQKIREKFGAAWGAS